MDVEIRFAEKNDLQSVLELRYEMLRIVNNDPQMTFSEQFRRATEEYFAEGEQFTVLALDGKNAIGCATMSMIVLMPTGDHPFGKRGHLMNVYVKECYRRNGIAERMVDALLDRIKAMGVTNVSLDATESGRPLYEKLGFTPSEEYMEMNF